MRDTKIVIPALATIFILLLSTQLFASSDAYQTESYTEEDIEINWHTEKFPMKIRYYSDHDNIPYVSLSNFCKFFLFDGGIECSYGGETYLVTTPFGNAVFDVTNDLIYSNNLSLFFYTSADETVTPGIIWDGAAFVEEPEMKTVKNPSYKIINLASYGLDIKGDLGETPDIWLPISVVTAFFGSGFTIFEGQDHQFYFFTFDDFGNISDMYFLEVLASVQKHYIDNNFQRTQEEAKVSYGSLCLTLDWFYGKPGLALLSSELTSNNIDKILDYYDDTTPRVKTLLKSTNILEYFAGVFALQAYISDGGHTNTYMLLPVITIFMQISFEKDIMCYLDGYVIPTEYVLDDDPEKLDEVRTQVWGDEDYYHEKGNTAVYTFNSFDLDWEGWETWYANGRTGEYPYDCVGDLYRALAKAKLNPEIKNFVIDLTTNGGGAVDALLGILGIVTQNKAYLNMENTITGWRYNLDYNVDVNLDGKFDSLDSEDIFGFRFAILESGYSFSCANALPCLQSDMGVMTIGNKSGGGSCFVYMYSSPDGILGTKASNFKMYNQDWVELDARNTPDVSLVKYAYDENGNIVKDYTAFYDIEALGEYIDEFYYSPPPVDPVVNSAIGLAFAAAFGGFVAVMFRRTGLA